MDTASGVYLHITDSSFETSGASSLVLVIPMTTVKGKLGINDVDATTFKDILGYDMSYNSNYYGLSRILEQVSHAYVWRLNQNAKLSNAYFVDTSSAKQYDEDATTFEDITKMEPSPILAIAHKDAGDWENAAVKFAPTDIVTTIMNENASAGVPQIIELNDVNPNELKTLFGEKVLASCIFYNSSNNAVVGIIKKNMDDEWRPYRVLDGEIVDDVIKTTTIETNTWTDGSHFYNADGTSMEEPSGEAGTPSEVATVRKAASNDKFYVQKLTEWFQVTEFTLTSATTLDDPETDSAIITELESASDIVIKYVLYTDIQTELVKDNSIGIVEFDDEGHLKLTINRRFSTDTYWNVHTIPLSIKDWTMTYAVYDGASYTVKSTVPFSFDVNSDVYIDDVDFGAIQLYAPNSFPSTWSTIRDYILLEGGSNGDVTISAVDIETDELDDAVNPNVLLFNGLTDIKVVNRICNKAITKKIHSFVDIPAFASYTDAYDWSKNVVKSQYVAMAGRPDIEETSDGKEFYVYPSVNYATIFASMLNNYGSLNYPPAGNTYGTISANNLLKCDYLNFANEMKTYRMNYQISDNNGTCIWEQRTTYSLNSDLSYIAPTFIVDDLADRIIAYERNFNFRYLSASDLVTQESGLKQILNSFVEKGFLSRYELVVPSYQEAQAAGRTLTVKIGVVVAKDTEVINIELELLAS